MSISSVRFRIRGTFKLKDREYINYIFNKGNKRVQRSSIIFHVESVRFQFLVSFKKRLFNSVKRNGLKRQIKEFIRLNQYNLKNIDCAVLIIRYPSSKHQLHKELGFLLK